MGKQAETSIQILENGINRKNEQNNARSFIDNLVLSTVSVLFY